MNHRQRRGHFLLISLFVVALIGVTLMIGGKSYHALAVRTRQAELDAAVAQRIADARLWIDLHPDRVAAMRPGETITLEVDETIAGSTESTLKISHDDKINATRIRARLSSGRCASQLTIVLPRLEIDE